MSDHATLVNLTQCLIDNIVQGNWEEYVKLCAADLTCFEPEAASCLVEGMDFHRFYFELERPKGHKVQTTLASPHVRMLGDTAIVSYVRLTQSLDGTGTPRTHSSEETRVWHKQGSDWKLVHFHRSPTRSGS